MAVAAHGPGLVIAPEWEAAPGVRSPELASTWARLEMRVGQDTVTQVEDSNSRSVRRSIYVSLYPLAEWVAFNWWYLRSDVRPGFLSEQQWSYRTRVRRPDYSTSWLKHHNIRAAGDGLPWPDLTIIPGKESAILAWRGDESYRLPSKVRFLSTGRVDLPKTEVERTLAFFVDAVLARLDEQSVAGTALEEEWQSLRDLDPEEVEFCMSAARLGLDPLSLPDTLSRSLLRAAEELSSNLLEEFLTAADPAKLEEGLQWVSMARGTIADSKQATVELPTLGDARTLGPRPWKRGLADAQQLRQRLKSDPGLKVDLNPFIAVERVGRVDRSLQGLGAKIHAGTRVVAIANPRSKLSERFSSARALWRFLVMDSSREFLLTRAQTATQQAERAFAAEFLAPATSVADMLEGDPNEPVEPESVAAISTHFEVNEWVIAYQIINQLDRHVLDDPRFAH